MTDAVREQRIEEANQLAALLQTQGWKVLEDEAKTRMSGLTRKLVWEDDEDAKSKLQANIRSLEFLLTFPLQMMEAAKKATEEAPREDGDPSKDAPA